MKNYTGHLLRPAHQALLVSLLAVSTGAFPAFAQTGGTGSSKYGTNPTTPSSSSSQTAPAPGSDYQTKTSPADVDSTTDVNTRYAKGTSSKLSWGDRRFVTKAADGGHDEVQLAQLAAERATNPEVRSFAQKLVDDHSKVNSELMTLASKKNVKVDADNDKDRAYKRLNKKSGSEFDQEFVEHMIDEHEKEIKMFEKASTDAKDADIRTFASSHVAHLREHLQQAQSLRQSVMPTGRVDDTSGRSTITPDSSSTTTTPATRGTTSPSSSTPIPDSTDTTTTPRRNRTP